MKRMIWLLPLVVGFLFAAPAVHAGGDEALLTAMVEARAHSRFMAAYMELKGVSSRLETLEADARVRYTNCVNPESSCPREKINRLCELYSTARSVRAIVDSWEADAARILKRNGAPPSTELSSLKEQTETAQEALAALEKALAAASA